MLLFSIISKLSKVSATYEDAVTHATVNLRGGASEEPSLPQTFRKFRNYRK